MFPDILGWAKLGAASIAGAAVGGLIGLVFGMDIGADRERARQLEQTIEDQNRRSENNETVRGLDSDSLFCDILSGLPIDGCP